MIPSNAPQWLKDAKTENAVVEIEINFGVEVVIWKSGVWRNGEWRDGVWQGGEWRGGVWRNGVWRGGFRVMCSKWYVSISLEGMIRIGCEEKTIKEWDKWFAGTEVFSTPRNSVEFKMIYAHYCAMKTYWEILNSK